MEHQLPVDQSSNRRSEDQHPDMEQQLPVDDSLDRSSEDPTSCWSTICYTLIVVLAFLVSLPLSALIISTSVPFLLLILSLLAVAATTLMPFLTCFIMMVVLSLPKTTRIKLTKGFDHEKEKVKDGSLEGLAAMYNQSRRRETLFGRIKMGSLSILARASLLLLVGLVLTICVPRLKTVILLGSPLWKWNLLSVTLTTGFFEALAVHSILCLALATLFMGNNAIIINYCMISMSFIIYFVMVLVSWVAYFSTDRGLKHESTPHPQAFEYVTWTLVSLLVGSIFCLFKAFLLFKWSNDAIYRRFEPRILITGVKYFFIGHLAADFFEESIISDLRVLDQYGSLDSSSLNLKVTKYVMSRKMDLSYIYNISRKLTSLAELVSPLIDQFDEDDNNSDAVKWFQRKIERTTDKCEIADLRKLFTVPTLVIPLKSTNSTDAITRLSGPLDRNNQLLEKMDAKNDDDENIESMSSSNGDESWLSILCPIRYIYKKITKVAFTEKNEDEKIVEVLHKLVLEDCSLSGFTFDDLKIWMVDAHKDCINMGRTLADAEAIVTRLDAFLSCVIFVIILLLWLLITGLESTKVLVTIATPLLALTFIFDDTAKTFFQGLVFCFATHPFDVGDRCILDDIELEVKRMSILTTSFMKIGTNEKRLYPNSVLATKAIVNFGWQPDPKDVVELTLESSINLKILNAKIKEFFDKEITCYKANSYKMTIKETGDNIKVVIKFTHVLTVHDLSHNQCLVKKTDQRSNFLEVLKQYINESQMTQINVKDGSETTIPYLDPSQTFHTTKSEIVELSNMQMKMQRKDVST